MHGGTANGGWRAIALVAASLFSITPALSQQPLTDLRFFLDDQPMIHLAPILFTDDLYLAPLKDTIVSILGEGARVEFKDKFAEVTVNERMAARIPVGDQPGDAEVYAPSGEGLNIARRVPLSQTAVFVSDLPNKLVMDLRDIGAIFGITVDISGATVSLYTPSFWCKKLALGDAAASNRTIRHLGMVPEFGISPPAKTHVLWCRPNRQSYVQMYGIVGDKVMPFFQRNVLMSDDWATFARPGYRPRAKPTAANGRAFGEAEHFDYPPGTFGAYVAVVTTRDLDWEDPLDAIRAGKLNDDEWAIVGFRERVRENPLELSLYTVGSGETAQSVAEKFKMDVVLLLRLNGYRPGESSQITSGKRLLVVEGVKQSFIESWLNPNFEVVGKAEVKSGETVASLCKKWGIDEATFFAANTFAEPGYRLEPGEIVSVAKMKGSPGPDPSEADVEPLGEIGIARRDVDMRQTSAPGSPVVANVPSQYAVTIVATVDDGKQMLVEYDSGEKPIRGYVPADAIEAPRPEDTGPPGPVAQEALKWIGTPYDWGGNNLPKGIDCSHFVAQVLKRAGRPAPSAPVVNQERTGDIVHIKPGKYRRAGVNRSYSGPMRPLSVLDTGDRIILQYAPLNDRAGSRHTGVYIGRLEDHPRFGDVRHAVVHASSSKGVTVCDLVGNRFMWKNYKFSLRDASTAATTGNRRIDSMLADNLARRLFE
jgi:cell wall-associated NlpC family hydrolase